VAEGCGSQTHREVVGGCGGQTHAEVAEGCGSQTHTEVAEDPHRSGSRLWWPDPCKNHARMTRTCGGNAHA